LQKRGDRHLLEPDISLLDISLLRIGLRVSGEVEVVYLPTEEMKADIPTKPLQGELFRRMRAELLGHNIEENVIAKSMDESESVGAKGCAEDTGTCLVAYSDLLWLGA
jgi:hypothetical protein